MQPQARSRYPAFLEGIRVVEIADDDPAIAYCGRLLAQLGADVLLVEPPEGSALRSQGPFPNGVPDREKSASFFALNFSKSGITLNVETPTGRQALHRLIAERDILIFGPTARCISKLELTPDALLERYPQLVAAFVGPFGYDGAWSRWRGSDLEVAAAGGASIGIGHRRQAPLGLPAGVGTGQAALAAVAGVLSSLIARESDGKGDFVDASASDVWATIHCNYITTYVYRGVTGVRMGNRAGAHYPDSTLRCKDGQVIVDCARPEMWTRLIELMGNPAWANDPRYQDRRYVAENYPEEVDALIAEWLSDYTREEVWALARQRHLPIAPLYTVDELVGHPHLLFRDFFVDLSWGGERLSVPGLPYNLTNGFEFIASPSPKLGQHNLEVLEGELSYTREEVIRMRAAGVV
jgi:crotonobetainyl-CoA:carnitine CoA-transferase CaiB-like acyl-CoA transferase